MPSPRSFALKIDKLPRPKGRGLNGFSGVPMKKIPLSLKLAALAAALIQVGCATAPEPAIDVRTVNVAVPVPCREPVPAKPSFPMDGLRPGTSLNQFVSAALAERLVRDGYQLQLETALRACTAP